MYVNDAVMNMATNSGAINSSGTGTPTGTFGQTIGQRFPLANRTLTVNDIKASMNPTSASIVNQATGFVTTPQSSLQPMKESLVNITKSNDTSGSGTSIFDNKYVLYGGIGLIAIGLIYFMTQD
jgi:hypothetical protein